MSSPLVFLIIQSTNRESSFAGMKINRSARCIMLVKNNHAPSDGYLLCNYKLCNYELYNYKLHIYKLCNYELTKYQHCDYELRDYELVITIFATVNFTITNFV